MIARARIPNLLTFARVAAVPVALAAILYNPLCTQWLFWLFLLASLTDFFDGYLARRWNATSTLGKLLDPMADKLLVTMLLLYFISVGDLPPYATDVADPLNVTLSHVQTTRLGFAYALLHQLLFVPVAIILMRELYVAGLREFMAGRGVSIPVSTGGKWKTATQMIGILLMLYSLAYGWPAAWDYGAGLIWLAALLALFSATDYTRKAWPSLRH